MVAVPIKTSKNRRCNTDASTDMVKTISGNTDSSPFTAADGGNTDEKTVTAN